MNQDCTVCIRCGKPGRIYSGLHEAVFCSEDCLDKALKYDDIYPPTVDTKPHGIIWKGNLSAEPE